MSSENPARFPRWLAPITGMSLKARLVLMTVGLFVVFIWVLAFLSVTLLQGHFEELLAEQQLANARRVASQVDARLKDNIEGLTGAAASLPGELSYELLQPQLSQLPFLHIAFSGGIAVIGLDGVAIADYPVAPGRRGAYYGDRDYFRQVVDTGKPYIDKPIIGRALKRPVLTTAVPVFAPDGRLRAVMTGITDLSATNFLGFVADRTQVGAGEYFVMSLRDRIIIAASDSKRNMQPSPAPGRNLLYDRMAAGFEGSGVATSSEGVSKLYSGVRVPSADWLILAALPAEIAFGPLRTLRTYLLVIAGLLTLAAALLIRLMLRRLLAPLKAAGVAMQQMTAGQIPLAPLPVVYKDEVGRLVDNFNRLIVDRQQYEAALADSEQRFRLLVEQAPDGIYVQTGGRFSYANSAALTLFGAQDASELLGRSVVSQVRADYQSAVAERIRRMNEQRECLPTVEQVYLKLDGTPIDVEISAVPFRYCDADGSLVFVRDITARKRADEAVRLSEARFHSLFDHMLEGFAYCRMIFEQGKAVDFVYLDVNPAFGRLTGLVDIIGKKVSSLSPTFRDDNAELLAAYGRVAAGGPPEKFEAYVVGLKQWFLISAYQADDDCFVAVFDVITRQKQAEENQLRLNRALRLLSDCNTALVHAEHEQGLLEQICQLVVEHGGYQMAWVGYAEDDAAQTVRPVAQAGSAAACLETGKISWGGPTADLCPTGRAIATGQTQVNHGIGTGDTGAGSGAAVTPWCEAAAACGFRSSIGLPLLSNKRVFGALAIYSVVADAFLADEVALLQELAGDLAYGIETLRARSQRAIAEARLDFLAHHDALTGLPNRLLLHDRFDRAVAQAERDGSKLALLFLDLDNFKQINDSLGHGVGDQLLVALAERLRDCIRDSDTISRQGGDEFIILMGGQRDVRMVAQVAQVAQKILETIAEPFEIAGNVLSTSFSVGISVYPDDARDFDLLLKNADAALYHAKDSGRNAYSFFASGMNVDALARMQLQSGLRNALKNQEFLLHYQPQLDIVSGRIIGVEALLRWQPADGPLVPPGSFIPVAEQSGLIIAIGEWVLHEACRQAAAWQAAGMPQLVVAVNLSALQFRRGSILDTVAAALASSGLPAHCLELELTESILLQDVDGAMKTLHSLKELGVQLSIDDFGTGYSSLSYLKRLAVDKLKIDQSFVRDIAEDPDDAAIVRAIVQLGHTMQLKVIAEGVETDRQLAFLCQYGCDQVQGYLFSRPLPAAALEPLLRDGLPGAQPAGSSASEIPSAFATPLP